MTKTNQEKEDEVLKRMLKNLGNGAYL